MKSWVVFAAVLLAAVVPLSAFAIQAKVTVKVSWTVLPIAILSIDGVGHGESLAVVTDIPAPTAADLARGYIEIPHAVRLNVYANTGWTVLVQALAPTLGASTSGDFLWPCEDLEVGVGGEFLPLSTRPQPLISGERGVHSFQVDYRVHLPPELPEGDWRATVLYTITTD